MMKLSYDRYLDMVLGGWIGKSIGGTIGARYEGYKGWIELEPSAMFPETVPPNDDLDLQVLWLKVLEEKGTNLTSDDMADAWLEGCWYPFNEYGIFRRNYRLGIHPPYSGQFGNQFWETGMGCPIRAEIWGYVFPGAPHLATEYARRDGVLDHTEQSVGAEMVFAAMASMAFFVSDVRQLIEMSIHYLPKYSPIDMLTRAALSAFDEGLSLRDAHSRLMLLYGIPEACDAQINVPFTILGLLYGGKNLKEVLLSSLRCGYDTDCTLATAGALIGQILGASGIPKILAEPIGDELVMGIEYRREEMTLSALARDTARIGVLFSQNGDNNSVMIADAPKMKPLPDSAIPATSTLHVDYDGLPVAIPGDVVSITVTISGEIVSGAVLDILAPDGWQVMPKRVSVSAIQRRYDFQLYSPTRAELWPQEHRFTAQLVGQGVTIEYPFGVMGGGIWQLLGVFYDPLPDPNDALQQQRNFNHHFVNLAHEYLPEPDLDVDALAQSWVVKLGRSPVIPSYEHEIDLSREVGLRGPYCAYLSRTVISPEDQRVYLTVGNNDSYYIYLNGERVAEVDESTWWTPFNNRHPVILRQGENKILVKILKRGDDLKFTLGFREWSNDNRKFNWEDWVVNLADVVPAILRQV